jgi:hypothetical protein
MSGSRRTGAVTLTALSACLSGACPRVRFEAGYPALDDGICQRPLGAAGQISPGPALAAASDGERLFFVDGRTGDLRVGLDGRSRVVAPKLVAAPQVVESGWLAADRAHAYWIPGQSLARNPDRRLLRVASEGGPVQAGFEPAAPVIAVQIQEGDGLLLAGDGLWALDLRDWGKARLILPGEFATFAADRRQVYLRPLRRAAPLDHLAQQVLGDGRCREPYSAQVVGLDRQTGRVTTVYQSTTLALFGPLLLDATHLYLAATPAADLADAQHCRARKLLQIPRHGGTAEARQLPGVGADMTQDAQQLYWIDPGSGRVYRTGKRGGAVGVVGQLACDPDRLLVRGGTIHVWKSDGRRCPFVELASGGTVASVGAALEPGDDLLAASDGWAYLADAGGRLRRISLELGLARGPGQAITSADGAPVMALEALAAPGSVFFRDPDRVGRWSEKDRRVVWIHQGRARALTLAGDEVYFATDAGNIVAASVQGAAVRTVVEGTGRVRDLAIAEGVLYWTEVRDLLQPTGRTLRTSALHPPAAGGPRQLLARDWLDLLASDGRGLYYSTQGWSRTLPSEREVPGTITRLLPEPSQRLADRQETIAALVASPRGVFWRQRQGVRWVDERGTLRALDCTFGDEARGLVASGGTVTWADASAGALLTASLPAAQAP